MSMNTGGYIVSAEQGPVWEMEPGRPTTFKLLSGQTGGSVAVFEEVVPIEAGTPLHLHRTSDEIIYILTGELMVKIGNSTTHVSAGAWMFIARGTPHGWKNRGPEPVQAAFIFSPADDAKFFEELRLLARPIPSIDSATLEALCKQHGYELIAFDWD